MVKRNCILGILLMAVIFSSQPVMGMETTTEKDVIAENNTNEVLAFLKESSKENAKEDCGFYSVEAEEKWQTFMSDEYIHMDSDGHFKINDGVDVSEFSGYTEHLDNLNLALDLQVVQWDEETHKFFTPEITADILDHATAFLLEKEMNNAEPLENESRGVAHDCSYTKWNVGATCAQNYNTIKKFYNDLLPIQQTNPDFNPWLSTASYWVSLVRPNGAWDYKEQKDYQTFCCTFGGVSGQDRSAEWIGNYNYGYTGKFLFDLKTLHLGSAVVSNMPEKDEATDWPAIDKGYSDAP